MVLKLTAPGIPDFYQGTELWDLSLVDPDNRRPVDCRRRVRRRCGAPLVGAGRALARRPHQAGLDCARSCSCGSVSHPCSRTGDYRPVRIEGALADAMIAFVRRQPEAWALVVAPRLALRLPLAPDDVRLLPDGWQDTAVVLDDVPDGAMNAFDGAPLAVGPAAPRLLPCAARCRSRSPGPTRRCAPRCRSIPECRSFPE